MRKLIYYIATTLDGFIAREDGSIGDFPWDDAFVADLLDRFPETFQHICEEATSTARATSDSTRS